LQKQEEIAMKKIIISLLTILAFSWASGVAAENYPVKDSPESHVICVNSGVKQLTVPATINTERCRIHDSCAYCTTSLENQGCKVVDVVVTSLTQGNEVIVHDQSMTVVTYMMSCVKP
jgi:hypothetical protein